MAILLKHTKYSFYQTHKKMIKMSFSEEKNTKLS